MKKTKLFCLIGFAVSVIAGVFLVPRLLKKITGILYQRRNQNMNCEHMGPEIVTINTEERKRHKWKSV